MKKLFLKVVGKIAYSVLLFNVVRGSDLKLKLNENYMFTVPFTC